MTDSAFKKSTAREYFESLVVTVILALFGTTFIVQAFKIPTPSMEDNLLVGDHLLVNKFAFGHRGSVLDPVLPFRNVRRGDVIVFKYPNDLTKHYVKRVVGLPGDRLHIANKQVFVNGEPLAEPYKIHKTESGGGYRDPSRDLFPPKGPHGFYDAGSTEEWFADYVEGDPRFGHDLAFPYLMVQRGRRAVYQPAALAFEKPTPTVETEYRRKVRMFEHCWLITLRGRKLRDLPPGYLAAIVSHRLLRYGSGHPGINDHLRI